MKILRRIYFGTHPTGDDIRYRYVDRSGIYIAQKAPSVRELKQADKLPVIRHKEKARHNERNP